MGYLDKLSDQELREELVAFNMNFPVTKTTRSVLIKKLRIKRREFFRDGRRLYRRAQQSFPPMDSMEWDSSHDSPDFSFKYWKRNLNAKFLVFGKFSIFSKVSVSWLEGVKPSNEQNVGVKLISDANWFLSLLKSDFTSHLIIT